MYVPPWERKWIVYKHTSPSNKSYIGSTYQPLEDRSGRDGIGYKQNTEFYNDIQKYGWENFKHEILIENLENSLIARYYEDYFMMKFDTVNNGYNREYNSPTRLYTVKKKVESGLGLKLYFLITNSDTGKRYKTSDIKKFCEDRDISFYGLGRHHCWYPYKITLF